MSTAVRRAKPRPSPPATADARWRAWFDARGWRPLPFQKEVWRRYLAGESGLLHTPTGSGKTLAAIGGPLLEAMSMPSGAAGGPAVLWITPLRALAADTTRALSQLTTDLQLDWQVAMRTGDASARDKRLARSGRADLLVITPESLELLLSYADSATQFSKLRAVIVDEWHELLGNKRGVLLQLTLARLRTLSPALRCWGLSATLGNLDEAREVLLPHRPDAAIVSGVKPRPLRLRSLLPADLARLPWSGHIGLAQLPQVYERVMQARSSLVFTNTRAQAELWHRALASIWLEPPESLALHHGSLSPALRAAAEQGLRDGRVRCVVATSSLDLGVDFPAVDQVFQIGSPKGVARLLQRAGRARHRPGESGDIVCVPTQALDLIEYAAARRVVARGEIESRPPLRRSLDVLAQHAVTLALGGGFDADALFDEVRGTHAYRDLDRATWQAVLDFVVQGGRALSSYPDFRRVVRDEDGRYVVAERRIATRHRLSIGTIAADGSIAVRLLRGATLGSVEEAFIGRLRPGDRFQFAGRALQLVRLENMTAYVRKARIADGAVASWPGGTLPLSNELAREVERLFAEAGEADAPELRALQPLLQLQAEASALPGRAHLLVEVADSRRGQHIGIYPFAGRIVNEGLAALLALRWARRRPNSFSYTVNDYGFMLSPAQPVDVTLPVLRELLSPRNIEADLLGTMNVGELARRRFRVIARVAGLLPPSLPGREPRSLRQLQASSGLIFDVLQRYDPTHLLMEQAQREVLETLLPAASLKTVLEDGESRELVLRTPTSLTPLSFPLWAEGLRGQLSTEDWQTRVRRAAEQLERRYARSAHGR